MDKYESESEIIYRISENDTGEEFFIVKLYFEKLLGTNIPVKMGGVMDEYYSTFKFDDLTIKLEYCNWTGTEVKFSKVIS